MKKLLYEIICTLLLIITLFSIKVCIASVTQDSLPTPFPQHALTKQLALQQRDHLFYDTLDLIYNPSSKTARILIYHVNTEHERTASLIIYDPFTNQRVQEIPLASYPDCAYYASFSTEGNYIAVVSIHPRAYCNCTPAYMLTLYYKSSYANERQHEFLTKHTRLPVDLVDIIADYHHCSNQYEEDAKKDLASTLWGLPRLSLQNAYAFHYHEKTNSLLCLQGIPSQCAPLDTCMYALQIPLNGEKTWSLCATFPFGKSNKKPHIKSSNKRFFAYYDENSLLYLMDLYTLGTKKTATKIKPVNGTPLLIDNSGKYILYQPTGGTATGWSIQDVQSGKNMFSFTTSNNGAINVGSMDHMFAIAAIDAFRYTPILFLSPPFIAGPPSPPSFALSTDAWLKLTPRKLAGLAVCTVVAATLVRTLVQKNMFQRKR